jgi:hypothetical protein
MSENQTLDTISRARCHGYEGAEKSYLGGAFERGGEIVLVIMEHSNEFHSELDDSWIQV